MKPFIKFQKIWYYSWGFAFNLYKEI